MEFDALRSVPQVEGLILTLHGGPVIAEWTEKSNRTSHPSNISGRIGSTEDDEIVVRKPRILLDDKNPENWSLVTYPREALEFAPAEVRENVHHWKHEPDRRPLEPDESRILRSLLLNRWTQGDQEEVDPAIATEYLLGTRSVRPDALKAALKVVNIKSKMSQFTGGKRPRPLLNRAIMTPRQQKAGYRLNQDVLRADTAEVSAAIRAACLESDPYPQSYAWLAAERVFYYSWRLTPSWVTDWAAHADDFTKRTMGLHRIVRTRWWVRRELLKTLAAVGYHDRMVTFYHLWQEYYDNGLKYRLNPDWYAETEPGFPFPRDEFFGYGPDPDDSRVEPFEWLGQTRTPRGTRLIDAARQTVEVVPALPWRQVRGSALVDGPAAGSNLTGGPAPEASEDSTLSAEQADLRTAHDIERQVRRVAQTHLTRPERSPDAEHSSGPMGQQVEVTGEALQALTRIILRSLLRRSSPPMALGHFQVVLALGRSGGPLATALSEALQCREMGWAAIARAERSGQSEAGVNITGLEFPLIRARRVLLVDSVVSTGATVERVLQEVSGYYRDAEVTVATYLLYNAARERIDRLDKKPFRGLQWAPGAHVALPPANRLLLPWKNLTRPSIHSPTITAN
jgi:orotate phosphoribosyltransferase-like protein